MTVYEIDVVVDEAVSEAADAGRELSAWLPEALHACVEVGASPGSLTVRLTDDEEIARLNASYRAKEGATDVLSFPGETTVEGRHLGDIVISVPTARRQGADEGHDLLEELRLLSLHGILHCLGYDHETDDGEMVALELRLREELF